MDLGRGCEKAVNERQRIRNSKESPGLGDGLIDWKNPIGKPDPHLRKPSVERFRLERIASPFQFDAPTNFGQNQDTGPDVFR